MKKKIQILLLIVVLIIGVQSCKKKEEPAPQQMLIGNFSTTIEKDSNSNVTSVNANVRFLDANNWNSTFESGLITINDSVLDGGKDIKYKEPVNNFV